MPLAGHSCQKPAAEVRRPARHHVQRQPDQHEDQRQLEKSLPAVLRRRRAERGGPCSRLPSERAPDASRIHTTGAGDSEIDERERA